jgi:hypothetical protein
MVCSGYEHYYYQGLQQALIIDCCQWVVLEKLLNNREISKVTLQF